MVISRKFSITVLKKWPSRLNYKILFLLTAEFKYEGLWSLIAFSTV